MSFRIRSTFDLGGSLALSEPLELDLNGERRVRVVEAPSESGVRLLVVESTIAEPTVEELIVTWSPSVAADHDAKARVFGDEVAREHQEIANRTRRFLRWRLNLSDDPRSFFHPASLQWIRADGTEGPVPRGLRLSFHLGAPSLQAKYAVVPDDAAARVDSGRIEPIAHELLREAIHLVATSRRGALVLGVAALESGTKALVADLVPDAGWLLEKTQSPPVAEMLEKYLPQLPVRIKINGRLVVPPPKPVMHQLRAAIEARNGLVHRGQIPVRNPLLKAGIGLTEEVVTDLLVTFRDVLYLLDVYSGEEWASRFVGGKTREALAAASADVS